MSRYWPNVSQCRSGVSPMPPTQPFTSACCSGRTGAGENEHMPTTSVVTPCRIFDSADGHAK